MAPCFALSPSPEKFVLSRIRASYSFSLLYKSTNCFTLRVPAILTDIRNSGYRPSCSYLLSGLYLGKSMAPCFALSPSPEKFVLLRIRASYSFSLLYKSTNCFTLRVPAILTDIRNSGYRPSCSYLLSGLYLGKSMAPCFALSPSPAKIRTFAHSRFVLIFPCPSNANEPLHTSMRSSFALSGTFS